MESPSDAPKDLGWRTPPKNRWMIIPALCGLPVEYDQGSLRRRPYAVYFLVALVFCASVFGFLVTRPWALRFGFVPAQPLHGWGVTWLTAFFLHVDPFHLISNLYYIYVFGDNVEDEIGSTRFLLLVLAAALAGNAFTYLLDPRRTLIFIGSSDAVFAILVFYILQFREKRVGFWLFTWIRLRSIHALVVYTLFQLLGAWADLTGLSSGEGGAVGHLGHLGGLLTGVLFWLAYRFKNSSVSSRTES